MIGTQEDIILSMYQSEPRMTKLSISKEGSPTSNGTTVMLHLSHCFLMYVDLQKNGLQVSLWLNSQILDSKENVLVVHCNAGKGRTGSAICAILLYMKVFNDIESCLKLFGYQRFSCTKGVTQPCQLRYLYYFEAFFKRKVLSPCLKRLKGIQFVKVPNISGGGAVPIFDVY